jgi:hypothetical protein
MMRSSSMMVVLLVAGTAISVDAAHAQMVRKVLIIGVDGMRPDAMLAANTPNFHSLISHGAFSPVCQAEDITVSGPGWSSILTGVHRVKHNVVDNSFAAPNYATYPHFFKRLQQSCNASTASIVQWSPVNTQICQDNADVLVTGVAGDAVASSCVELLNSGNPDVVFLHFDDVDHAGHAYGFSPTVPQYLAAIESVDAFAGRVLTALAARPTAANEDWLVIVTSDHGGTPDGTHGRDIPEHRNTGLIVSGRSTAIGTTITPTPALVDVPATVMTFLGLAIDPAWGWDGRAVGLNMSGSPSRPFACSPPPPPPVGACCLPSGECRQLTSPECEQLRGSWAGLATPCDPAGCAPSLVLLSENFESLPLGPNVDETMAGANVWSATPPAGWSVDRAGVPSGGVTEWRGWNFASRSWWSDIAGNQNRSLFTKATGAVAVADPDEWSDLPHGTGLYASTLSTRRISLTEAVPGSVRLIFDSSWRPEDIQAAEVSVQYDAGASQTVALWTSAAGPNYKPDSENETVSIPLATPPGASSMVIKFTLRDAGNNWWWAIDNLEVLATPRNPRRTLLRENFDSVPLGPNVDETLAADRVWSGSPPSGWTFDDSGVPGLNERGRGVTEWKGWCVADRLWWTQAAADQRRSEFTRASGAVAVADPDEWDDIGSPSSLGAYNARMSTPPISLRGIASGSLRVAFDSSWRPEGAQAAILTATFDDGSRQTLLGWSSEAGPKFHGDAPNEHLQFDVPNPANAGSVVLSFALLDARNNWWWAIDNLEVSGSPRCLSDINEDGGVDGSDVEAFFRLWETGSSGADLNADGGVDGSDVSSFFERWESGC